MAATTVEATPVEPYALCSAAYSLSKTSYLKLRALPVLGVALPLMESTTAFALEKAGLPAEMDALEASFITPALSKLDETYVGPAATQTVKYADAVKEKCAKTADNLGSRGKTPAEVLSSAKTKTLEQVDACKTTALGYYDDAKDAVANSRAKVVSLFTDGGADESKVAA
mmetsp:Transcript_4196/g.13043  ORF Transcript_4196/g.13043 Transcript_4196/m.13043 type:complete len:170 (+) Transcript_4196:86-595(+)|eukprot:CAMPEP_0198658276 /NCGR_PEP_ID=MMETSP1467-20131203/23867_1 /TAXON_ID=1462469 /ORGANISM="unid. sp., Strain CCMP2135" /LENGTH=169 /DNA_ID=CAMNT_0044394533 /DNA_START=72 /DNA_END=581 /DNA_ORIENTATION=-